MSDPAAEPGAPVDGASKAPLPSEKSVSRTSQQSAVTGLLATPDRILLRLNKLLALPGGLSTLLSTFNYTLYLVAYAQLKSGPVKARINEIAGKAIFSITPVGTAVAPPSAAILAALIGNARTTFRLVGLLPMYAWMRQLITGPKQGQDEVLWATAFTQCSLYITFQLLENIAVLQDGGVISKQVTARWNPSGDTARLKLWSYRAWFGGILCDFVRLAREAQLERTKRANRTDAEVKSIEAREEDTKT